MYARVRSSHYGIRDYRTWEKAVRGPVVYLVFC